MKRVLLNVKQHQPRLRPRQVAAADGAITILDGVVMITKGTAAALTLADPPLNADTMRLLVVSTTAAAHTVSNAAGSGFNGGGAGSDVGTFGAAIANSLELVAYNGKWWVINNVGVTLA
jgi:hypothetical protein